MPSMGSCFLCSSALCCSSSSFLSRSLLLLHPRVSSLCSRFHFASPAIRPPPTLPPLSLRTAFSAMAASLQALSLDEHKADGVRSDDNINGDAGAREQGENGSSSADAVEQKGELSRGKLEDIEWDHSFAKELPGDPRVGGPLRQVLNACYSEVPPSALVKNPELVVWSRPVAEMLELSSQEFERSDFAMIFSGAMKLKGSLPYAQCYGGHQFGVWAGQLGDGRAITLGELLTSKGERWDLQLKGAGKTPYSRMADGLAVLRSSVREFLCSEAMHHLGIPTTRALCLVTTGEGVVRDMFYDGNPKIEPGAIVCRVAQSFLRFGSYQIHAARENFELVRKLADYTIKYHFPKFERSQNIEDTEGPIDGDQQNPVPVPVPAGNDYAAWFGEVAERTASLVSKWQCVGFTHGVLNTDNMSILGLTIDYGPFGFLDAFDPKYTPNTTDMPGRRYCFANQPDIGMWNLMQLANTLLSAELISTEEAQSGLERYADKFMEEYQHGMTRKIGLKEYDKELIGKLLSNMAFDKADFTNFFRALAKVKSSLECTDEELLNPLKPVLLDLSKERKSTWTDWLSQYRKKLALDGISDAERKMQMDSINPKYILRNYLCQSAIDAAEQGDYTEIRQLLKVMERPFEEHPGMEKYARLPPAWAYRPGVCMLSCSS